MKTSVFLNGTCSNGNRRPCRSCARSPWGVLVGHSVVVFQTLPPFRLKNCHAWILQLQEDVFFELRLDGWKTIFEGNIPGINFRHNAERPTIVSHEIHARPGTGMLGYDPFSCPRKQAAVLLAAVVLVARPCACDPCGAENSSSFWGCADVADVALNGALWNLCWKVWKMYDNVWHMSPNSFDTCSENSASKKAGPDFIITFYYSPST